MVAIGPGVYRAEVVWKCEFMWPWNKGQRYSNILLVVKVPVPNLIHQPSTVCEKNDFSKFFHTNA